MMQIGEVAARAQVSLPTLRHYDEVGLVRPSARSEGGFRLYTEADLHRLEDVRCLRFLGLSVEEVGDIIDGIEQCRSATDPHSAATGRRRVNILLTSARERLERMQDKLDRSRRFLDAH
ncbi:MerR family transcriptional regulator [Rhodococcus opacus M213]|uniref:MerR family transcriptional regulator n=1 Tax=Rhodococcus opacus M213 TaxID=1129896 RepID=K8XDS6_RHOOP|nr:MerR family transcriptional regulator [Rhodococcus opacus]EKT79723.1 MerR family transcriptional regulator [Rhodococcus opacus M213]